MISKKKLKGSALPTVMVVSVLICLLILFAFTLFDLNEFLFSSYNSVRQRKEYLNSALVVYCNDSSLITQIKESDYTYQLYDDEPLSSVQFSIKPWGLYESICISSSDHKYSSIRLLGKKNDCKEAAALWLCSRDMSLSLAGTTQIEGPLYAPINGVNYVELQNEAFKGRIISNDNIHLSNRELPDIDSLLVNMIDGWHDRRRMNKTGNDVDLKNKYSSFKEEPIHLLMPENASKESVFRGQIMIYGDEIVMSPEMKFSDVILIARKVIVESGFVGSCQIFATDTVIVKEGVRLNFPSGVFLNGNNGKTLLTLGERSTICGYAVVFGDIEKSNNLLIDANYEQRRASTLQGLLYVDGIASVNSCSIIGAAYMKECYYLPENSMYAGTLFNVQITRDENMVYPFLFKNSMYRRSEIKSLH